VILTQPPWPLPCRLQGVFEQPHGPVHGTYATALSFLSPLHSSFFAVTGQQIARVNAAPALFSDPQPTTGFLLHHQDVNPLSVLSNARRGDTGAPCVARIGDGGWGAEDRGDMIRTIVDVDPEEWSALWERRWQMYLDGIWPDKHDHDAERWSRLDMLRAHSTFFVDAARAPEVLRLIARYVISLPVNFNYLHELTTNQALVT